MIVVDTSALLAVVLREVGAERIEELIENRPSFVISAGTLQEALIVAGAKQVGAELELLLEAMDPLVEPVDERLARAAADAYARWGKGNDPAGLNLADCHAYALAADRNIGLLFVGNDFARTDVKPAL